MFDEMDDSSWGLTHKQVIHVRGDSDSDLEALFNVARNPKNSGQTPMHNRKFPPSFFTPPVPQTHPQNSLYNKLNSPSSHGLTAFQHQNKAIHLRAHSSPANLLETSVIQQQALAPSNLNPSVRKLIANSQQHVRSASFQLDDIPLPDGWQKSFTSDGKSYFIDHNTKQTQWEDPRKYILIHRASINQSSDSQITPVMTSLEAVLQSVTHDTKHPFFVEQKTLVDAQQEEKFKMLQKIQQEQDMLLQKQRDLDRLKVQLVGHAHVRQGSGDSGLGGINKPVPQLDMNHLLAPGTVDLDTAMDISVPSTTMDYNDYLQSVDEYITEDTKLRNPELPGNNNDTLWF